MLYCWLQMAYSKCRVRRYHTNVDITSKHRPHSTTSTDSYVEKKLTSRLAVDITSKLRHEV